MQVINKKKELKIVLKNFKSKNKTLGFVPTMGALHLGHLSLIEKASAQTDVVVVSIFVNPTQFDNASDLEKYPRILENDVKLLSEKFDNIILFAPSVNEVYEGDQPEKLHFDFGDLANKMEGKFRDGHFDGVATVLTHLFDIVQPDKAFFGEKDYQQLLVVKKLVEKTDKNLEIVPCEISREPNGLARSSRNERLTSEERQEAAFIYDMLLKAKKKFGIENATNISEWVKNEFQKNEFLKLEYFEIANAKNLEPAQKINQKNKKHRAFIAAYLGDVRLIDNIALN